MCLCIKTYGLFCVYLLGSCVYVFILLCFVLCVSGHPRELTEEEKQQVLHSEEFLIFFDRSIRVMERALAEDSNIFFDYSGRDLEDKEGWESDP